MAVSQESGSSCPGERWQFLRRVAAVSQERGGSFPGERRQFPRRVAAVSQESGGSFPGERLAEELPHKGGGQQASFGNICHYKKAYGEVAYSSSQSGSTECTELIPGEGRLYTWPREGCTTSQG